MFKKTSIISICLISCLFSNKAHSQSWETNLASGVSINGIPTYNVSQALFPNSDVTPFGVKLGLIMSPQGIHINPNLLLSLVNTKYFKLNLSLGGIYHLNKGFLTPTYKRDWDVNIGISMAIRMTKHIFWTTSYTYIIPDPIKLRGYGDYARPILNDMNVGGQICSGISFQY
jgi:hypothetical protein